MIEDQIYSYKSESYNLFKELKSLEAEYKSLIDICTKLQIELETIIQNFENKLDTQRKEIVIIIRENLQMTNKINFFKLKKRFEDSVNENPGAKEFACSTPNTSKINKSKEIPVLCEIENLKKLTKGINEIKIDIDVLKQAFKHGVPISELNLPQKIRATFETSLKLLASSTPGENRNQIIKLVDLLNVSQISFI